MLKNITVYDCGVVIGHYTLNATSAKELVNTLLAGTDYDIIITNREDDK